MNYKLHPKIEPIEKLVRIPRSVLSKYKKPPINLGGFRL